MSTACTRRGYHWTSWAAWQRIRREGLRPRVMTEVLVKNPSLARELGDMPVICFYPRRLCGVARWGQVLWTMVRRETSHVVCLSFLYRETDIFDPDAGRDGSSRTMIYHDGTLSSPYNTFRYHDSEPLFMLTVPVPPERIRLEQEWNIR